MSITCPSAEEIRSFVTSGAVIPENAGLIEHLSSCPSCQELMDRFSPAYSRPPSGPSTESHSGGQVEGDPELARAILRGVRNALWEGEAGETGGERFRLVRLLGSGGMGEVFEAVDTELGRRVALKTIRAVNFSPEALARLKGEAQALAGLEDPGIVRVHAWGTRRGLPYLAMEYVDGETLGKLLERGRLAAADAARLMATVARAMDHAHRCGLVHRDLKPSNILLAKPGMAGAAPETGGVPAYGQPKVIDFGLAKWVGATAQMTQTGTLLGTPAYMAPEQAEGGKDQAGPRSDIYSLGAVLYQCLTGQPPFPSASVANTLQMIRHTEPAPPRLFEPSIPRDLETICLKCLLKEPEGRYRTGRELAEDLERFLDGRPILARPAGPLKKLWRWVGRNRNLATALGAVAGLLLAVACLSTWYAWREAGLLAKSEAEAARANGLVEEALAGFKTAAEGLLRTCIHLRWGVDSGTIQEKTARVVRKDLAASLRKLVEDFRKNPELVQRHPDWLVELVFARTILAKDAGDTAGQQEAEEELLEILSGMEKLPRNLVNMELEVALVAGDRKVAEGKVNAAIALWQSVWSRHLNPPEGAFLLNRDALNMLGQLKDRWLCAMQASGDDQDGAARLLLQWEELGERVSGALEK